MLDILREKMASSYKAASDIQATADKEEREITEDEGVLFDAAMLEHDELKFRIEAQQKRNSQLEVAEDFSKQTQGRKIKGGMTVTSKELSEEDPSSGFANLGEFCEAVRNASQPNRANSRDERLFIGAQGGVEGVGTDGGFIVPPEFADKIYAHTIDGDGIMGRTDNRPISGNSISLPTDETTPWGADGINVYWEHEAAQATATKPEFKLKNLRLNKLFGFVRVTDELLDDSMALGDHIMRKLPEKITWKCDDVLYSGKGAGQPRGILSSAAAVTVAKESGQSAKSVVVKNISKMLARVPAAYRNDAVWMLNPDLEPELIGLTIGNQPAYIQPGYLSNAPSGMLLGRPIITSEHCLPAGKKGDIALVNWRQYLTITSRMGMKTATSMHFLFDTDQQAFRATFRMDGEPWMSKPIKRADTGSDTLSAFVFLADRT